MTAQPNPEPLTLEEAAASIYGAQQAIKGLCAERDELTAKIGICYRSIEDDSYVLRQHFSETQTTEATIGGFEVAVKLDDKRLKVARILVGSTGEARVFPRCNTSRIVVRKAKL